MPLLFQHVITLIARIMVSLIFIAGGALNIVNWASSAERLRGKLPLLTDVLGATWTGVASHVLLAMAIVLSLLGGLSVLIGLRARVGTVLLLVFLVPTTVIMHNFWALDSQQAQTELINFMKNVGLLGGLLMILAFGSGGLSADVMLPRRRETSEF
jgi:putative oxidoreductase